MDDERIERALRAGPPDEPAYEAGLKTMIATSGSAPTGSGEPAFHGAIGRVRVRTAPRPSLGALRLAGPIAAVLILVVAAVGLRLSLDAGDSPTPEPGDLLARLRNAGVVRIAITTSPPQTLVEGGSYIGFDVAVAGAVSDALGLRDEPVFLSTATILAGGGTWDVGFPSRVLAEGGGTLTATAPYYDWPSWLVVASDSVVGTVAELDGGTICVVRETAGAGWLAGRPSPGVDAVVGAPEGIAIERSSDAECITAVLAGDADALITATLLDAELVGRGVRALGDGPVLSEARAIVVRGTGPDVTGLVGAINRSVVDLTASGRLAELSRASFGGRDLTGGAQ